MVIEAAAVAATEVGLTLVKNIFDLWANGSDSLIDYSRVARVEPITLIDNDCMMLDNLNQILQTELSMFAGYYLQAIALSATVNKVTISKELEKFNPTRSAKHDLENMFMISREAYKNRLPMTDGSIAMEAEMQSVGFGRDTTKDLREENNLAVGKQFMVEIAKDNHKATIPINIRLQTMSIPTTNLLHILSIGTKDTSFKERFHAWRSGQISFIKDLCLCQDLIDDHRSKLLQSKDTIYRDLMRQRGHNLLSGVLTGTPTISSASNLIVMSEDTVKQLEKDLPGKFSDFNVRQKVFKETYLMIVAVVDKEWDQVTFYHRGIPHPTEMSFSALKTSNSKGSDVAEIMKAYRVGHQPSM